MSINTLHILLIQIALMAYGIGAGDAVLVQRAHGGIDARPVHGADLFHDLQCGRGAGDFGAFREYAAGHGVFLHAHDALDSVVGPRQPSAQYAATDSDHDLCQSLALCHRSDSARLFGRGEYFSAVA